MANRITPNGELPLRQRPHNHQLPNGTTQEREERASQHRAAQEAMREHEINMAWAVASTESQPNGVQVRATNGHNVPPNGSQVRGRRRGIGGHRGSERGQTRSSSAPEAETNSRGGFGRGRPQRGRYGHGHGRRRLGPPTRGEPNRGTSRTEPGRLLNGHGAFGGPGLSGRGEPHHGPGPHYEDGQGRGHGAHRINGVNGTGTGNRTD